MKTKSTGILIVVFGMLTFLTSNATSNELLKVSFKSENIVNLVYTNAAVSRPRVTIYDSEKNIVFTEQVTNNYGVARLYNFSALPEGDYTFEILDGKSKSIKAISYKKVKTIESSNLKVEIVPAQTEGKFNLICKGNNNSPIKVVIYDNNDDVVFEDNIESKQDFKRVYDLSRLNQKSYVFEVSSGDQVVTKQVILAKQELSLSK